MICKVCVALPRYKFPEFGVIGFHLSRLNSIEKNQAHLIFHLENISDDTILELHASETRLLKNIVSAASTQLPRLVPSKAGFKYSLLGLLGFAVCFPLPS